MQDSSTLNKQTDILKLKLGSKHKKRHYNYEPLLTLNSSQKINLKSEKPP